MKLYLASDEEWDTLLGVLCQINGRLVISPAMQQHAAAAGLELPRRLSTYSDDCEPDFSCELVTDENHYAWEFLEDPS